MSCSSVSVLYATFCCHICRHYICRYFILFNDTTTLVLELHAVMTSIGVQVLRPLHRMTPNRQAAVTSRRTTLMTGPGLMGRSSPVSSVADHDSDFVHDTTRETASECPRATTTETYGDTTDDTTLQATAQSTSRPTS